MTNNIIDDLGSPRYGAEAIGREARLFDKKKKGKVDIRKVYYALEKKYIDADKFGKRLWVSTPRRIRRSYVGKAT